MPRNLLPLVSALCAGCGLASVVLLAGPTATAGGAGVGHVRAEDNPTSAEQPLYVKDKSKKAPGAVISPAAHDRADRQARADAFLAGLLAHEHSVVREGPWTTYAGAEIGIVREYAFAQPVDVPMQLWPSIDYKKKEDKYSRLTVKQEVRGMKELTVFIDGKAGVVMAYTDPEASITPSADNGPMTRPEGGHS